MKVLIPVQDSVFGDAITAMVTQHNWPSDTQFKLLTVIEYASYGEMLANAYCCETTKAYYAENEGLAKQLQEVYAGKLAAAMPGVLVEREVAYGPPKEVILDQAELWQADIIVMGSHARKGLSRFLLGSVSSAVLSQAPCSVIIVKLHQPQKTVAAPLVEKSLAARQAGGAK